MELRHLRYFVAVAEELHFGHAAARLHTAQSSLSAQIRDLENELGVPLLHRTKRQVNLTDSGRAFLDQARAILRNSEHAIQIAQRANRGELGKLGIGFVPSADCISFPEILRVFKKRYPEIHIDLRQLTATEQIDALHHGDIDVGFMRPLTTDRSLRSETIFREPFVVVLPKRHPLTQSRQLRARDLVSEPLLLCSRRDAPLQHDALISMFRAANLVPNIFFESQHIQTILGMVGAGIGISILPASVQNLRAPGLDYVALKNPSPVLEMSVMYRLRHGSEILSSFLGVVRELSRKGFTIKGQAR
jgi:DNA-binding transcriptional LysR family regulator